ncbi:aspartate carbamoyltransferase catalytic subunit [Bdellovibrio sp. qaytius]|nr:aspartate carbamoyltransferase catalytic subunit [Bdellovibrio sp. qaytius]
MSTSYPNNILRSVIDLKSATATEIYSLFEAALKLKKDFSAHKDIPQKGIAALLFFEPSTRTRFSFEAACARSGVHPLVLSGSAGTSLEKDETLEDTILNIEAMKPLFFVIRSPDTLDMRQMAESIHTPIINAGWGKQGHPTQALLDMLTVFEKFNGVEGKKILFVGDIKHSRVVSSHLELAKVLGYKIGYACPANFLPSTVGRDVMYFSQLKEGLQWADAVVALRVQKERHIKSGSGADGTAFSVDNYKKQFSINNTTLEDFRSDGLLLHPGPINYGVELEKEVLQDSRSQILKLVENGAFVREALIRQVLQGIS